MSQRDFGSSRILPLLLLLGTALPAVGQKIQSEAPPPIQPQKLSDAEIAVLREKRESAVWLQKFIAARESLMDTGSSLALMPNPCDDFEIDNPSLPDAKAYCKNSRALYTILQKDMEAGTDNLPSGWKDELIEADKQIPGDAASHKIRVNILDQRDPAFDQVIASSIGRVIDLSQGKVSQEDTVILSGMNLIDAVQDSAASGLRSRLLNYMVEESHPPAEKTEAIRLAIKLPVDKAATALILSWLAETTSMQQGMKDGNGVFLFTTTQWEDMLNKNLREARAAASVIRSENNVVAPPAHSSNPTGATF